MLSPAVVVHALATHLQIAVYREAVRSKTHQLAREAALWGCAALLFLAVMLAALPEIPWSLAEWWRARAEPRRRAGPHA